jgi:hypothetical protein
MKILWKAMTNSRSLMETMSTESQRRDPPRRPRTTTRVAVAEEVLRLLESRRLILRIRSVVALRKRFSGTSTTRGLCVDVPTLGTKSCGVLTCRLTCSLSIFTPLLLDAFTVISIYAMNVTQTNPKAVPRPKRRLDRPRDRADVVALMMMTMTMKSESHPPANADAAPVLAPSVPSPAPDSNNKSVKNGKQKNFFSKKKKKKKKGLTLLVVLLPLSLVLFLLRLVLAILLPMFCTMARLRCATLLTALAFCKSGRLLR